MSPGIDANTGHRMLNMSRTQTLVCTVLGVLAMAVTPICAGPLIDQAYESGAIDLETARLYRVYEAVNPEALPAKFHSTYGVAACGTPVVNEALAALDESGPEYRRQLLKTLQRPILSESAVSPSGHFRIHYDTSGRDAVDLFD